MPTIHGILSVGGGSGTSDYESLTNLPRINNVTVIGNKPLADYGIQPVPTTVSSFTNDAGYQNASQVSTAINEAIAGISGISFEIVQTLPVTGDPGTIYLVPDSQSTTGDIYVEWIYLNNSWEKLGTTAVDLTGYTNWDSENEELEVDGTAIYQFADDTDIDNMFS